MNIKTKTVDLSLVGEKHRKEYGIFLDVFAIADKEIDDLTDKLRVIKESEGKKRKQIREQIIAKEIEIIAARVFDSDTSCAGLCLHCGSYAAKHYDAKTDGNIDDKIADYACKVCGFNRFAQK